MRLSGKLWEGKGNWIIGANFENDNSWDSFLQTYNASSADPSYFLNPNFLGNCLYVPPSAGTPYSQATFCQNGTGIAGPAPGT